LSRPTATVAVAPRASDTANPNAAKRKTLFMAVLQARIQEIGVRV
jgi:hypothetical protein